MLLKTSIYNKVAGLRPFLGLQLYYKETPAHVFSWDDCKIFKNTFFYTTPPVAGSSYETTNKDVGDFGAATNIETIYRFDNLYISVS